MSAEFIKTCIAEAFVQLLYEKNYYDISITDICKKAGYGRTTYYRHFTNQKEAILEYIAKVKYDEYKKANEQLFKDNFDLAVLTLIYTNRNFILCLQKQGLIYFLFNIFEKILFITKNDDSKGMRYVNSIRSGWYLGSIITWINDGFDLTPNEVITTTTDALALLLSQQNNSK